MANPGQSEPDSLDEDSCFFEYFGREETFEDLHLYKHHGTHSVILRDT